MKDEVGVEPVLQQEALCLNNDSSRVGGDGKVAQPPSEDQTLVQWGIFLAQTREKYYSQKL